MIADQDTVSNSYPGKSFHFYSNSQERVRGEPSQPRSRGDGLGESIQPDDPSLIIEPQVAGGQLLEELFDALLVVLEVVVSAKCLTGLFTRSRDPGVRVEEVVRFVLDDDDVCQFPPRRSSARDFEQTANNLQAYHT